VLYVPQRFFYIAIVYLKVFQPLFHSFESLSHAIKTLANMSELFRYFCFHVMKSVHHESGEFLYQGAEFFYGINFTLLCHAAIVSYPYEPQ